VERTINAGLAGLAPLLTAAHDEATRAAEAAAAAGRQAAEAASSAGQRTAEIATESGRLASQAATEAGRQAVAAASGAGQQAAAAAVQAGRETVLRVEAAEARLGDRLDLATDRLATYLGDFLTGRFAGVGEALAAQEARAQQGQTALQHGVTEQLAAGREATERGLAALHERSATGATSAAMDVGFSALHARLEEVPGRFDLLGQRMDAAAAVADRAALTAQAAEQAARDVAPVVASEIQAVSTRTADQVGGRIRTLVVLQILTLLAVVGGLVYIYLQTQGG
jgi:hypothetical protein